MAASDPSFPCVHGRRWTFDLFLSCSGEDTSKNFTDHLYSSLTDAGINTFRNGGELPSGEEIVAEQLVRAIHESQICLVVFSKNYADSRSRLDELAEIVKSTRVSPQLVLPVFYDVDPADVRKQSKSFSKSFAEHEQKFAPNLDRVANWRAALTEAASLSGWDLKNSADRHEGKFIKKIIKHILKELSITHLNVATYPVGIEARLQKLSSLLAVGTKNGTLMLGICGKGGIGKTTLSKAIYNQYFHSFEGKSFLANIRGMSTSQDGLIHLQEKLLMDVLKEDKIRISGVEEGCDMIKGRLWQKRVIIVLDDVDQIDQVKALSAQRDWFGLGSRIIITTRNMELLEALKVEELYEAENFLLSEDEALELFCWHAFEKPYPSEDFYEYAKDIASCFGNSPLALKDLGSFLSGRAISEWKSAIEKWKSMSSG